MSNNSNDIIIGEISNAVTKLVGSSAAALMRNAGMAASKRIWPDLPPDQSVEEAGKLMTKAIKDLSSWGEFAVKGQEGDVIKIEFQNCYFAGLTKLSGKPCGEQAICYFGSGLVEETLSRLTGLRTKVELKKRDDNLSTCFETATKR